MTTSNTNTNSGNMPPPTRPGIIVAPTTGNIDPALLEALQQDFVIVDVETTGPDVEVDRIVEIAILRFRNGERELFHTLVDPQMPIPPESSAVHHITDEMIREAIAPTFEMIADRVAEMLTGVEVFAHQREWDSAFIDKALDAEHDPANWNCTVRLARHLFPQAPAYGNQALRYWFKTKPQDVGLAPHRAAADVLVTAENLFHMVHAAQQLGLKSLEDIYHYQNQVIYTEVMTFGPHAGEHFSDIPSEYFTWALGKMPGKAGIPHLDSDLRASMEREMAKPERNAPVVAARVMDYGKQHRGKAMSAVPLEYLEWIERENPRCPAEVRAGVADELARRRAGGPSTAAPAAPNNVERRAANESAPAARVISSVTFAALSKLVIKGSAEEARLQATQRGPDPRAQLEAYLQNFAAKNPVDYKRVADLMTEDVAKYMLEVAGSQPAAQGAPKNEAAAPAPAAARSAPRHEQDEPSEEEPRGPKPGGLFAGIRKSVDPEEDDNDNPPDFSGEDAPFASAAAKSRMRPR